MWIFMRMRSSWGSRVREQGVGAQVGSLQLQYLGIEHPGCGIDTEQPAEPRAGMEQSPGCNPRYGEGMWTGCYPSVLSPFHFPTVEIILPQGAATGLTFLRGHRAVSFQWVTAKFNRDILPKYKMRRWHFSLDIPLEPECIFQQELECKRSKNEP